MSPRDSLRGGRQGSLKEFWGSPVAAAARADPPGLASPLLRGVSEGLEEASPMVSAILKCQGIQIITNCGGSGLCSTAGLCQPPLNPHWHSSRLGRLRV